MAFGLLLAHPAKMPHNCPTGLWLWSIMGLLTNSAIKAAKPNGRQQTLNDGQGLQLRISQSGHALTWFYQYRHPVNKEKRRIEYGAFPQLSLAAARAAHLQAKGMLKQGIDPIEQRELERIALEQNRLQQERELANQENSLAALCERWYRNYALRERRRPESARRTIEADIIPSVGNLPAAKASRAQLIGAIEEIAGRGSPAQAREVLVLLKQILAYGEQVGVIDASPIANVKAASLVGKKKARDRVLSLDEIRAVWQQLPDTGLTVPTILAIKLLLVTGQRRGELIGARWEHINRDRRTWTIPETKNGKTHTIPLSFLAEKLFDELALFAGASPWCFAGKTDDSHLTDKAITRAVARKREQLTMNNENIPPWSPHDLRRTAATQMAALGVAPHIIERILNHTVSSGVSAVFGVYARHDYMEEMREALDLWAERIVSLMAGDKVIPLPTAKRL